MAVCLDRMGILNAVQGDAESMAADHINCEGRTCWFCWQLIPSVVETPAVYWASNTTLYFHAECAEHFGAHILKDALVARLDHERKAREKTKKKRSR